jgi:hypothetical protein
MAGKPMGLAWAGWTRGGLVVVAALALSACEDGLGTGSSGTAPAASEASGTAATDVAAPDVFHVTEAGLWDGRPSLGGIWVAHPDVTDPERVRIVNQSNGQEIIGALFRRERDLPGPALQVSSDAAEGLGMLAGAPVTLDVTAIRRQEAPAPATPAVEAAPAAAAPTAPEPATEAEPAAQAPAQQAPASQVPAAQAPAPAAAPAPRSGGGRGLFGGLFGRTPAAAPAAGPGGIATTPLDGGAATDAAPPASPLQFPYVQLATLSTEAAATEAAQALAAKGLPARVAAVPGQDAWRLLLGPATTEAQQTALREQAVAEGFADAYLVRS